MALSYFPFYKKYLIIQCTIIMISSCCFSQESKLEQLIAGFRQPDFTKVKPAKQELENLQTMIMPKLIELLEDTGFVQLTNTFHLNYPCSPVFYPHGSYLPYHLDWVSVRAGWLLEELTFMDFGYQSTGINDSTLFKLAEANYAEYLQKGTNHLDSQKAGDADKIRTSRNVQALAVRKWWNENKANWTRLSGIESALKSGRSTRQLMALQFLRFGETRCANLSKATYRSQIKPLVSALRHSSSEVAQQAVLVLSNGIGRWTEKMAELDNKDK